ncbi:tRNA uridine-5-carboxymethylaminomethyl(34) synthesis enzyme MnmG [bacterium]|nr:tRNA uridine-5-carboxymethylaminomethyl(34) synthesis enzyme MnmG [bacterium]
MKYDVVIVGGGHAGIESASASARLGLKTALITFSKNNLGEMSCNPSIGGLGKGHLVREIDALDGVMAKAIDKAGTQFRVLNASKGAAVQGPRAQADRTLYKKAVNEILSEYKTLDIIEDEVVEILFNDNFSSVNGVILKSNGKLECKSVVLTTGTFLNGIMHTGEEQTKGGRIGEIASYGITESLKKAGFSILRLKTGTPARLSMKTIDYTELECQESDEIPEPFSYMTDKIEQEMIPCYITYTNLKTHKIITDNKDRTPLYNGQIQSIGPRYCPSIEDKVVRFSHHESHHIFLEQEGYGSDVIYPNGISTSLPKDVQEDFIHSIKGLENVKILRYGYAIEYDAIDARELKPTLGSKRIKGLYFAGQINGTSGYEEAASQGILAGINAGLFAKGEDEIVLDRSQAYIGVLVDDITTLGVDEPYRMFTSRSEYRLSIRADNADQRLTPLGIKIGVVSDKRAGFFNEKMKKMEDFKKFLTSHKLNLKLLKSVGIDVAGIAGKNLYDALRYAEIDMVVLRKLFPKIDSFENSIIKQIEIEGKYQGYLKRQEKDIEAYKKDQSLKIPANIDYDKVGGLTLELKSKLKASRPDSLASASRIQGMTPAGLTSLLKYVKK